MVDIINIKIQTVLSGDLEELTGFWRTIDGVGLGQGDDLKSLEQFIRRNPHTCLLIRDEGKVVGSVLGGFDGRRGYIYHLAVSPERRRQGMGRLLMNVVCRELEKQGAHKIHLFVFNGNHDAIGFYQRLGWDRRSDIQVMSSNRTFVSTSSD